jgi:hypothetical protein
MLYPIPSEQTLGEMLGGIKRLRSIEGFDEECLRVKEKDVADTLLTLSFWKALCERMGPPQVPRNWGIDRDHVTNEIVVMYDHPKAGKLFFRDPIEWFPSDTLITQLKLATQ